MSAIARLQDLDDWPAERWGEMLGEHPLVLLALVAAAILAVAAASYLAFHWASTRRSWLQDTASARLSAVRGRLQPVVPARVHDILGRAIRHLAPRAYLLLHLAVGLVASGAVLGFLVIADETAAGEGFERFDAGFARAIGRTADVGWRRVFFVLTQLGSTAAVALVGAVVAVRLYRRRAPVLLLGWVVAVAGGSILNWVLKAVFERARPDASAPFYAAVGWSFPSGHAMSALVTAGMLAYLAFLLGRSWRVRLWGAAAALSWAWIIGFTRLYLGVHYPSDVVAGYLAAMAWLAAAISGTELARRRRR